VAGWDLHGYYVQRIRNYTGKPIDVEVRRTLPGHIVFRSALRAKNHTFQTVEFRSAVQAGKSVDLRCEIVSHEGTNKKQDNVTIVETADNTSGG